MPKVITEVELQYGFEVVNERLEDGVAETIINSSDVIIIDQLILEVE